MKYEGTVRNREGKKIHTVSHASLSALLLYLSAWVHGKVHVQSVQVEWSKEMKA